MEKYYKVSAVNDTVEKLLREPYYQHSGESWYSGVCAMADALLFVAPPTFVEEPKIAKWNFNEPDTHGNKKPYCSNCGEYHLSSWSDYTRCKYCPNCGAKMITPIKHRPDKPVDWESTESPLHTGQHSQ
jgi:predicted RNA-binding Zn-ribbon protein involved in translation (DUF1610 family)